MRVLLAAAILAACGPADRDTPATDGGSQVDTGPPGEGSVDDGSRIYAHSGQSSGNPGVLFQLDAVTLGTTSIGPITGLGNQSLTDLAVDKNERMVGVTLDKLYEIDRDTGAATLISELPGTANPTSLSFVPIDLDDPNSADVLITADSAGGVFQIDPVTGATTQLGDYGTDPVRGKIRSSGDLFAVRGLGIFATVDIGDGDEGDEDFLARIDPVTWQATPIGDGTGFDQIFGVGFWAGKIYGFVDEGSGVGGKVIQIDPDTGAAVELAHGDIRWFGAAVTTAAPIL